MDRLRELIDHGDDLYVNQQALVNADCAFHLVELLSDENDSVTIQAARVIILLTDHSAPAKAKLHNGIGLENIVSKVMLNPVQGEFIDAGAIPLLVGWLTQSAPEQKTDVALQALTTISSYNHEGKVAYLESLVGVISSGHFQCLEYLDDLISGIGSGGGDDTVFQLYEKASISVVQAIKIPGQIGEKAITVLGTICEHAPELAKELETTAAAATGESSSIISAVAKHLLFGSIQAQDTAARTLWYLTLGDKTILGPEGPLVSQIEAVAGVLRVLVERSAKEEEEDEAREDLRRSSVDYQDLQIDPNEDYRGGSYHYRGSSFGGGGEGFGVASAVVVDEVCFSEEAEKLLKAVIAANPELKIDPSDAIDRGTSCCVM